MMMITKLEKNNSPLNGDLSNNCNLSSGCNLGPLSSSSDSSDALPTVSDFSIRLLKLLVTLLVPTVGCSLNEPTEDFTFLLLVFFTSGIVCKVNSAFLGSSSMAGRVVFEVARFLSFLGDDLSTWGGGTSTLTLLFLSFGGSAVSFMGVDDEHRFGVVCTTTSTLLLLGRRGVVFLNKLCSNRRLRGEDMKLSFAEDRVRVPEFKSNELN